MGKFFFFEGWSKGVPFLHYRRLSEELLLKLIEQLQPPPELREKMLALFAKAKGTLPPDINAELSKNPKLWGLIRQLIAVDPSEEQITQIEQLIYAGISASGGTTNDIE